MWTISPRPHIKGNQTILGNGDFRGLKKKIKKGKRTNILKTVAIGKVVRGGFQNSLIWRNVIFTVIHLVFFFFLDITEVVFPILKKTFQKIIFK